MHPEDFLIREVAPFKLLAAPVRVVPPGRWVIRRNMGVGREVAPTEQSELGQPGAALYTLVGGAAAAAG